MSEYRIEKDSMGEVRVPSIAYWGAQTQRAVENFPVSGLRFPRSFIRALALIKQAAATVNMELGLLDPKLGQAIVKAAGEVADGLFDDHFVLDIFQTGSGTSTNMNANEVISNRAIELLGGQIGSKKPVHPNDHVNMSQSSNDVIPTAMHVAAAEAVRSHLVPELRALHEGLVAKAAAFDKIVKIGRTHLADATPIRLGQEFSGYAAQVKKGIERVELAERGVYELAIGGTAVGTGINTHPKFGSAVAQRLGQVTELPFTEAENHFEAQAAKDAVVELSGTLKTIAVSLTKIANDLRWLASGPRCGISEIHLPDLQPGSSIMPGKVNPVIPEMVLQVAAQVIGNDVTITMGGQAGNFELNVMMPVMAYNLLQSIEILARAAHLLNERCVVGIEADEARCRELIERSLAMCTSLAPKIGYDEAAAIAKEAYATGKTVRELAKERGILPGELDKVLNPWRMTEPGLE